MSNAPIAMQRMTEKLRAGVQEYKCEWVNFPNQKLYLLPIVSRSEKITPLFTSEGVFLDVREQDEEVSRLANKLIEFVRSLEPVGEVGDGKMGFRVQDNISDVFALIRRLIITNYDMSDLEITEILTVTSSEMSQLFEKIFKLILQQ